VPVKPVSPLRVRFSLIGFGAGVALGLALAVLLELRDQSFRSESDLLSTLALPVLASIPMVATASERKSRYRQWVIGLAFGVLAVAAGGYVFWTMRLWTVIV
jgi:predicted permease